MLTVQYTMLMSLSDFEDAIYVRANAPSRGYLDDGGAALRGGAAALLSGWTHTGLRCRWHPFAVNADHPRTERITGRSPALDPKADVVTGDDRLVARLRPDQRGCQRRYDQERCHPQEYPFPHCCLPSVWTKRAQQRLVQSTSPERLQSGECRRITAESGSANPFRFDEDPAELGDVITREARPFSAA